MDGSILQKESFNFAYTYNANTKEYLISTLLSLNVTGNVTSGTTRDVYGLTRASYGTATSRQGFVGQSCGHMTDPETGGLVYMRARYYDPQIGRFESQDKVLQGQNWFTYCNANPVNNVDKSGGNSIEVQDLLQKLNPNLDSSAAGGVLFVGNLFAAMAFWAAYSGLKNKDNSTVGVSLALSLVAVACYAVAFGQTSQAIIRELVGGTLMGGLVAGVVSAAAMGGVESHAVLGGFSAGLAGPVIGASFVYSLELIGAMI